ncbi:MAG: VacJ family lipoprotein [Gammaproteobacteria bacterium]|nr:VacJ family lipoprotein [Gammaproteobacteria bacterium]
MRIAIIATAVLLLSGCATLNASPEEHDPFERVNRSVYRFNDVVDRNVLKPVAEVYDDVVPNAIDTGITNFFSNLGDVLVLVNNILQAKPRQALSDFSRIVWNTTVGLFGLIDVATPLGLPKHNEDFGQTLGYWGVETGPYLVLPFLGPSTVRDGAGSVGSWYVDPLSEASPDHNTYYGAVAVKAVDTRAGLLKASSLLEQAALDPYVFMREAYLQHRLNLVHDGAPPAPEFDIFDEEFDEELDEEAAPETP